MPSRSSLLASYQRDARTTSRYLLLFTVTMSLTLRLRSLLLLFLLLCYCVFKKPSLAKPFVTIFCYFVTVSLKPIPCLYPPSLAKPFVTIFCYFVTVSLTINP